MSPGWGLSPSRFADSVPRMERNYSARAYKTLGQNEHQTEWVRELVSEYETTDRSDLLGWVIAVISEHGSDGDGTIDWVEAWSDDPDDAWSMLGEASHETIEEASEQMLKTIR